MNIELPIFGTIIPQYILLLMTCGALIANLFVEKRYPDLTYYSGQTALILCFLVTVFAYRNTNIETFNGLIVNDLTARLLQSFIYLSTFLGFLYGRDYIKNREIPQNEYYLLGLLSTLGAVILCSADSLITLFLALELLSLPLYAMIALKRDSIVATEAALKYFIMGAIASGLLLYGMSLVYGATGALDIQHIAHAVAAPDASKNLLLSFGIVFILAGVGFKFAAAPFHMWAPDVYTGAPNPVTLFLASVPKLAAAGLALRLIAIAFPTVHVNWQPMLIIMSILSMGAGNLLAIAQQNIKRMLAYSAIGHVGYILLGFIAATPEGYSAVLFYMLTYSLMALAGFGLLCVMSTKQIEIESINDFKGLSKRNPGFAFAMMLTCFSLAGIPPTVGFLSKLFVLQAVVNAGYVWLAAIALGFAIVGVFYYIRIVKLMYFDEPTTATPFTCPTEMTIAMNINGALLLLLGIFPTALWHLCAKAFGM